MDDAVVGAANTQEEDWGGLVGSVKGFGGQ